MVLLSWVTQTTTDILEPVVKDEVTDRGGTNIILTASVGYTIDNTESYILTGSMPAISLYSNGANWFVF